MASFGGAFELRSSVVPLLTLAPQSLSCIATSSMSS